MQFKAKYGLLFIIFLVYGQLLLLLYGINSTVSKNENRTIKKEIVIATVVCGSDRINETLVMVKSTIYFTKVKLTFIIFADDIANNTLQHGIASMRETQKKTDHHNFEIHPISFPNNNPEITETEWKNIFRPCSCQRLFLPVRSISLRLPLIYFILSFMGQWQFHQNK